MVLRRSTVWFAWALVGIAVMMSSSSYAAKATVLHNDKAVAIENTLDDPNDLWVTPEDLTRASGFVLKPEGACLDDICVPIRQSEDSALFVTRDKQKWVNLSELARKLNQAMVADAETRVWSLGEVPAVKEASLQSGLAPDFELPDMNGKMVKLSDFRGKKVLLLTWASW